MVSKTWAEKLTWEQRMTVENELKAFGLDQKQIYSLMHQRSRVKPIELQMMRDLPSNRWGKRPTINVVRMAIHDAKVLGLIKVVKRRGTKI